MNRLYVHKNSGMFCKLVKCYRRFEDDKVIFRFETYDTIEDYDEGFNEYTCLLEVEHTLITEFVEVEE